MNRIVNNYKLLSAKVGTTPENAMEENPKHLYAMQQSEQFGG